jgi:hypothetical protein
VAGTYLIVGHLTTDYGPDVAPRTGGAVYFGAAAAAAMGWSVRCLARAESPAAPWLPAWLAGRVSWCILPSATTTAFVNGYDPAGRRMQRVLQTAPPIGRRDVPVEWRTADVVHLATVVGELTPDVLDDVSAPFVGLAAQGWLRDVLAGGEVTPGPWRVPAQLERRSHAIALSEEDLGPGRSDPMSQSWQRGDVLVAVTRGAEGADLYHAGAVTHIPAVAVSAADSTGAGDVFAATLFVRLAEGASVSDAGDLAAAQAAMLVQAGGILGLRTRDELGRLV